jgi:hypothetical protein
MAPYIAEVAQNIGQWQYIIYALIGFAFGYVLEIAGFGVSTKLAGQFYFREMTVLKVMFGAIIVAMTLIFLTTGLGLLDYNLLYVNPTYLWPGIVGGLIMGVGFILGGFCPGTSLVSAATLKIDGIVFVLGVFFGIFMFGETVGLYDEFWFSSYLGRFTLQDLFGVDAGVVVLIVVIAALIAFAGAEWAEKHIGKMDTSKEPKLRFYVAGGLVVLALATVFIGQPTPEERWERIKETEQARLDQRLVQIHPAELLANLHDRKITTMMIDIRSEADYNRFHILDAMHVPADQVQELVPELLLKPANTLFVVIGNDETQATEIWRMLVAQAVPNVYILEGGVNNWLATYSDQEFVTANAIPDHADDQLAFTFASALGSRYPAANPNPEVFEIEYETKVQPLVKRGPTSGGCG